MSELRIFIITGHSGSGKTTALRAFEDAGYFCVDNMPVALLPRFLESSLETEYTSTGLVFVMDMREKGFVSRYPAVFSELQRLKYNYTVLFLEADESTLLRRYSETRRHHPLAWSQSLIESIRTERAQLQKLRRYAHQIIDTSRLSVHELKRLIRDEAHKNRIATLMRLQIMSFGFKHGIPLEADLVVDVRFLANPFFIDELKPLNGEDAAVQQFVLDQAETRIFLDKYTDLLDFLIPLYEKEGKAYLTIAVGCTGGQHRSVAIARFVYEHIQKSARQVEITHRDLDKNL